jgi:drug/metabolite transporter (DMT)-like permease
MAVIGWGSNWPPMKLLLAELPPMAARTAPGLAAALLLALLASAKGEPLAVPRRLWGRLWVASLLNITAWMGFAALALLWLGAAEACLIAYTMPVWASLLAWPVLGERPRARHLLGLACGLAGLAVVVAGQGLDLGLAKLPGVGLALACALLFALGAVVTKRWPVGLPPLALVAWQVGLGVLPLGLVMLLFETPDFGGLSARGWWLMAYMATVPLNLCYLAWFAALRRLPASVATTGSLLAPVVGVLGSALVLDEPFGLREVAALGLVVGGVVLAVRG